MFDKNIYNIKMKNEFHYLTFNNCSLQVIGTKYILLVIKY